MTDRIETDVHIAAPVERVWELITQAEHVGRWFGDVGAEIELRPGGRMSVDFGSHGTIHGRVETVEPPRRFAWRWLLQAESRAEPTPANSTLTEFTLASEAGGTRVVVVESGFDGLSIGADDRVTRFTEHTRGWVAELNDLVVYAAAGEPAQR